MPKCPECGKACSIFEIDLFSRLCKKCIYIKNKALEPRQFATDNEEPAGSEIDISVDMRTTGIALIAIGVCITVVFAFLYDASVASSDARVNNVGLLNNKTNGVFVGMCLAIMGSVFYVGGRIEAIYKNKQ